MNNRTEAKLTDLSGMQKAIEEILKQAWERGRKYGQNEERPKGEWIFDGVYRDENNSIDNDMYHCNLCKRSIMTACEIPTDLYPFCHCGADMRSPSEVGRYLGEQFSRALIKGMEDGERRKKNVEDRRESGNG